MFKKKPAIQLTFVPKKKADATHEESHILHPDTVDQIAGKAKSVVKHVAIAVIGVYAAVKVIDTASQIAIKKTKSADND